MKYLTYLISIVFLMLFEYTAAQIETADWSSTNNLYSPAINLVNSDTILSIEDPLPELSAEGRKPLLLIHGWNSDGNPAPPAGSYWNNFINYLKNDPDLQANFKPYLVRYWSNAVPVIDIAEELRNKVEALGIHEQKIVVIGHSMGGLVARSFMNDHQFTKGISMGQECGANVDLLITLSSPHHGSPMANGPARNSKVNLLLQATLSTVDALVFNETQYNQPNRSDLHWDNFDGLFDYQTYANEKNNWLIQLNQKTIFDARTICYSGSVDGQFVIPEAGNLDEVYSMGAWFMEQSFGFTNDGIVPIQSSQFYGHTVKKIRYFDSYNHINIIVGKTNQDELFGPLKTDLMELAPLKINWPSVANYYVKHSQYRDIEWEAPATIEKLDIYFSSDNGSTYTAIAKNIDAASKKYSWHVPDINSTSCLIKIVDAEFSKTLAVSANTFTIFHNKITVASPTNPAYFVRYKDNTIKWTQEGLGNKVKLIYTDSENGIEEVIASNIATQLGSNSYVWSGNNELPATSQAQIKIELQNLLEDYGDGELYSFSSKPFELFGEANFDLLSPKTNPTDYFGIKGEEMVVNKPYAVEWYAEGEIKYLELYLCDKNKEVLKLLAVTNIKPKLQLNSSTNVKIPDYLGDEFYFLARAGVSPDSIFVETYSEKSFRINNKVSIITPANNDTTVSLYPCFELEEIAAATTYTFYLSDTLPTDQYSSYRYESTSPVLCVPALPENELQPGLVYQLTAVAMIGDTNTFTHQVYFKTEATKPKEFQLLSPLQNDSTSADEYQVLWRRAIGANHYELTILVDGEDYFEYSDLSPTDTTYLISLPDMDYYTNIEIQVSAVNSFGATTVAGTLFKHYRTGIQDYRMANKHLEIKNYPNPFNTSTTFEFVIPEYKDSYHVVLSIYTLNGKKLQEIHNGIYQSGQHQMEWIPNRMQFPKGNYIYQIKVNGYATSKPIRIE